MSTGTAGRAAGTSGAKDQLAVVAHHLFFRGALLLTERGERVTQLNQSFFRRALQLLRQTEEIGYADPLNHADIHLSRQHLGALVLQQFLQLMHEDHEVQRIQAGFDERCKIPTR